MRTESDTVQQAFVS